MFRLTVCGLMSVALVGICPFFLLKTQILAQFMAKIDD